MPRNLRPLALSLAVAALAWAPPAAAGEARLGLFTTLPLYWPEADGIGELIAPDAQAHWVRGALERDYLLVPLDVLGELDGLDGLLLAQPRPLSPEENVALDDWVRGGGHVLLFADPMLTGETIFGLGDRRRPQDVVLLSPILAHWGLELRYDDDQPRGETGVALDEAVLPVNRPGSLAPRAGGDAGCAILAEGLVAECAIGAGRAVIVADAAVLEGAEPGPQREQALADLLRRAFGEIAGQ